MDIEEFKTVKKHLSKQHQKPEDKTKKLVLRLFNQILITAILFLGALIAMKMNVKVKSFIQQNVYTTNFKFAQINDWYEKYLGSLFPNGTKDKDKSVFQEKLVYQEENLYKDGVSLKVTNQYLVPLLESGIVVFMGEKEGYGSTVIVQQVNGMDVWYGNVTPKDIKMYDYVEKGHLLGESKSETLYLVFQKEGKFLNYKDYLK